MGWKAWRTTEIAVLRELYSTQGIHAVKAALPNRTETAIIQRANELGLIGARFARQASSEP